MNALVYMSDGSEQRQKIINLLRAFVVPLALIACTLEGSGRRGQWIALVKIGNW